LNARSPETRSREVARPEVSNATRPLEEETRTNSVRGGTSNTRRPRGVRQWRVFWLCSSLLALAVLGFFLPRVLHRDGNFVPVALGRSEAAGILGIAVLVFREGLECVLVLAALTASLRGAQRKYRGPVSAGVVTGVLATLVTWSVAVRILNDLGNSLPALALQAATGLLAILVLLLVMNWFFHKLYWTGWISLHNQKKQRLLSSPENAANRLRLLIGMAMLGFSSFYREGFEVVLLLQGYRFKLGSSVLLGGVLLGVLATVLVAVLTFLAHRRLPYRSMLVWTGVLLGVVLLVMVGEEAQEMQLAHWLPMTPIPWLVRRIPSWMGLWFSVFPTGETLAAQLLAAVLVLGSYLTARPRKQGLGAASPDVV